MSKISHWFLPHRDTHQKAHLISWEGMLIYVLLFLGLQVGFNLTSHFKPGVLGITGDVGQQKLIELTNIERQKAGLPTLKENSALDNAAKLKAENMFKENYWAHYAPSGKTPWDFILGAGYNFSYAGENLAKNFYTPEDVVTAWINSPSHKENLLNSKYQDIGMAVMDGVLNGQKTTLVVQEFGTSQGAIIQAPKVNVGDKSVELPSDQLNKKILPVSDVSVSPTVLSALIDPFQASRIFGFAVIFLMGSLLLIDFLILRKRGVFRINSYHLAHFAILSVTAAAIMTGHPGSVL